MKKVYFFISFLVSSYLYAAKDNCSQPLGEINYDRNWFESKFNPIIDKVLDNSSVMGNYSLHNVFTILCCIAVIFHIGRICSAQLLRGGDTPFDFGELRRPFFILIAVLCWSQFEVFVREGLTGAVSVYVKEKESKMQKNNDLSFNDVLCKMDQVEKKFDDESEIYVAKLDLMDKVALYLKKLPISLEMGIAFCAFKVMAFIDYLLMVGFTILSKIWLFLVGLGGGIALTTSVLSGGWSPLITWVKTYVSVSLWVLVGGICMSLVNGIGVALFNMAIIEPTLKILNMPGGTAVAYSALISSIFSLLFASIVMIFLLTALKIILLVKVPVIINTWIPGGNAAGGGFSAAFIPLSVAKEAAGAAVNAVAMGTIGGVGGKGAGGLKGQ